MGAEGPQTPGRLRPGCALDMIDAQYVRFTAVMIDIHHILWYIPIIVKRKELKMSAYFIVDCSTGTEKKVQFFGVAVEDDYSYWPLGHAYWHFEGNVWAGNFDTKIICERSIDDLINRIHKRKGINADVRYMEFPEFREFIYRTHLHRGA